MPTNAVSSEGQDGGGGCPVSLWRTRLQYIGVVGARRGHPSALHGPHGHPGQSRTPRSSQPEPREPTARAITNSDVINAAVACIPIRIFARLVNGIVSVGLNALEFVVDKNR